MNLKNRYIISILGMIKQISLLIRKKIKESFSRKKKGLIFLNSVPIQNVQLMSQIKLLCKQFLFLCVTNVFNVLGAVDLFTDFNRKN